MRSYRPKRPIFPERLLVRFAKGLFGRLDKSLKRKESRAAFIRVAVETEIEKRTRG